MDFGLLKLKTSLFCQYFKCLLEFLTFKTCVEKVEKMSPRFLEKYQCIYRKYTKFKLLVQEIYLLSKLFITCMKSCSQIEWRNDKKEPYCNATPFQIFCIKMEPRLSRSISQHDEFDNKPANLLSSAESKLIHVSGRFGQFIENFTVTCDNAEFIPTL